MPPVRYAVGAPNGGPFADVRLQVELARRAGEAGWDGFFLWDHVRYRDEWPVIDPWLTSAAIATVTQRLRLGVMVAGLARQLAWEAAKPSATLDQLSGIAAGPPALDRLDRGMSRWLGG